MKKILITLGIILSFIFSTNQTLGYGCMEYGFAAQDNYNGTCSCMNGYHFETTPFGSKHCVKDPTCYDTYGWGAQDNYDGTCSCSTGYVWGTDMFGEKQCVTGDSQCSDKYGIMSNYDNYSGKCECKSGYVFSQKSLGGLECKSCSSKYGLHSSYSYITKSCGCDDGYTLKDGKCEEKHNSAYFYLSEYNDDNNEAIVISYHDKKTYVLELRYTTGLYKAEQFIGKSIVINMGTDFDIDRNDKFILNNQTSTTDIVSNILSSEEVDSDYTLQTCEDLFGDNIEETYDNKCKCSDGYAWNNSNTSCIEINDSLESISTTNTVIEDTYRNTQMNKYYESYKSTLSKSLAKKSITQLNALKPKILKIVNTYESSNTLTKKKKDEKVALFLAVYLIIEDVINEK